MRGERKDFTDEHPILQPGEYGRHPVDGNWYCHPPMTPRDVVANLASHTVIEHDDRTITVSPSIRIEVLGSGFVWHGYLEQGEWREV